jgi:cell shape-determining protein MreC
MELNLFKTAIFVGVVAYSVAAVAQQAAPTPPAPVSTVLSTLDRDWQSYNTLQAHVFDDILALAKENTALKAENDKLKADAAKSDADTKAKPNPSPSPTK